MYKMVLEQFPNLVIQYGTENAIQNTDRREDTSGKSGHHRLFQLNSKFFRPIWYRSTINVFQREF